MLLTKHFLFTKIIINQFDKSSDETPSFDDTTDENIAKFKVAAKSKGSTSKPEKVTTRNPKGKPKDAIVADQDKKGKTKYFGGSIGSDNPMLVLIDIPDMLHLEGRLFESRGCLLLNDAFYWLETENRQLQHYKLNIKDHDHPIITTIEIPHGLHRGRNFLESFGSSSDDLILMLMEIPQMLHLEGKFFESCGCLLLVCRDDIGSREFTIYNMMKGYSVCLARRKGRGCFLMINLSGKVVKYNLISNTINEIFNIGSNQIDDDDDDEFIRPFSVDPNVYEFIPSFVSV
ncbi:hypothetical protein Tco_0865237 [Tanacetum coccineum]